MKIWKCPLKNVKGGVEHPRGILFVDVQTLIEDVKCEVCEALDNCGHHKHLEKIEARKKANKEKAILNKQLQKLGTKQSR